ncbi:MAG: hypothetical protein Q7T50_03570 [Candidatus Magasanikbacteria bacterium]|nr:hypothetical protein [Candidatus Magasanikbacteria bacterium]
MKKEIIIGLGIIIVSIIISLIMFYVVIPTHVLLSQSFWSDSPVCQRLIVAKSPAEIEGPTPPKSFTPEMWQKKFSHRITGELPSIEEKSYYKGKILVLRHKDGAKTIYLMELPNPEDFGPYRIGLDL